MAFSFEGLKFWVSIHAPGRTKRDITNNGGIVVAAEKDADICIMDPARAGQNPAKHLFSHVWITDCIRQQTQLDEGPYRVATIIAQENERRRQEEDPPAERSQYTLVEAPRARPPAGSLKRVRNEYSREDDRILVQWLREKAAEAEREHKYPHHTYHSWRSRWINKLSKIVTFSDPPQENESPRRSVRARNEEQQEVEPRTRPREPIAEPQPARQHEQYQEQPRERRREQETEEEQPDGERVVESSGGPDELFFMDFHDYYIMGMAYKEWKKQRRLSGERAKPTRAFFKGLHQKRPELSTEEWQEKYSKLRSLYVGGPSSTESQVPPTPPRKPAAGSAEGGQQGQSGQENKDGDEDQEDKDQDGDDGFDIDDDAILSAAKSLDNKQKEFLELLDGYNSFLQFYVPPSFFIGGRYLETYTLWTAVQDASGQPDKRDWNAIVNALGFDSTQYPVLATQLEAWYDHNLKEFGSFLEQYKEEAGDDDEEEDDDDDEDEDEDDADEQAQAEPSGSKTLESISHGGGLLSSARQILSAAFSAGRSTPTKEPPAESPSKRVRFSSQNNQAQAESDDEDNDDDKDDNGNPVFESRQTRSSARRAASTPTSMPLEPDTQDFAYGPATQADVDMGDANDNGAGGGIGHESHLATPSQQLHTEERIVATAPLSLPAPGSARRKRPAASSTTATPMTKRTARRSMPPTFNQSGERGTGKGASLSQPVN
ncbi:hypothetical protein SEUCBS139899_008627 [Sporothrix eucalyptigena]